MRRAVYTVLVAVASVVMTSGGWAQEPIGGIASGNRGPRFLLATAGETVVLDVSRTPLLHRRVSIDVQRAPLRVVLDAIAKQAGFSLSFSPDVVNLDAPVTLDAKNLTVAAALTEVLINLRVDVVFSPSGQLSVVRQPTPPPVGTITGRVTDASTQQGIEGVRVFLEGTRSSTTTGSTGSYRLTGVVAGAYTLVVRRLGYREIVRAVTVEDGREVTVDVTLQPVPSALDEVVVTVAGEQRLRELGHVVGRINADSLMKEAPIASVTELLTARIPGLQVQQKQGTVGGDVKLQIRSASSIVLSNEPIIIVDGMRYTSNPRAGPSAAGGYGLGLFGSEGTSRLNDLNPNDVESIEVVKGPSAATLYGTDAANGVIVITTKRGRPGPAQWNTYGRLTTTDVPKSHYPDRYWGWGTAGSSCALYRAAAGSCTQDSVTVLPNPLNDPEYSIFERQPRWEYGGNVAGGRQDVRYYFSGDFERAVGAVRMPPALIEEIKRQRGVDELPEDQLNPNSLTKANLRANVTAALGKTADVRVNAGYTRSRVRALTGGAGNALYGEPGTVYPLWVSPAESFAMTSIELVDRFSGNATGEWRPRPWLFTRAAAGIDLASSTRADLVRRGEAQNSGLGAGAVGDERTRNNASTLDAGATATFRRGRVSARTSVGAQYVRTLYDRLLAQGYELPPGGSSIGEAASVTNQQDYSETATLGTYVEQSVGVNDRLFVTGALRVDGASGFGRNYDTALYPKAGVSWLLSEEPFLPRLPGIDELRFRYAFGASAKQPWPVWSRPLLQVFGNVLADGTAGPVVNRAGIGNPDLRPERVQEHEFGLDAAALDRRLRLELTWDRRRTIDQLTGIQLAPEFGGGGYMINLGRIDARGFEAHVTARLIEARVISWDVVVGHAWHTTTIADLGGVDEYRDPNGAGWAEGYPVGARFIRPIVGYADANGDGIIGETEVQLGESMVYAGVVVPPRTQTLTTTIGLFSQRLRLAALLDRQSGFTTINEFRRLQCTFGYCRDAVDPSTPLAAQAEAAALRAGFGRFTYIEQGDFTRLREVSMALDLPARLTRAMRLSHGTLSVSARNLALWDSFSGADPESRMEMPQARSWTLRLDLDL